MTRSIKRKHTELVLRKRFNVCLPSIGMTLPSMKEENLFWTRAPAIPLHRGGVMDQLKPVRGVEERELLFRKRYSVRPAEKLESGSRRLRRCNRGEGVEIKPEGSRDKFLHGIFFGLRYQSVST